MVSVRPGDIQSLRGQEDIVQFFRDCLGYRINIVERDDILSDLPGRPRDLLESLHQICDYRQDGTRFAVFHAELNAPSLRRTDFRTVLEPFYRRYPQGNYLFIFTLEKPYERLTFASPRRIQDPRDPAKVRLYLRTLTVERDYPYRTDLEILDAIRADGETSPEAIWQKHLEAFNVERVTEKFFRDYREVFGFQLGSRLCASAPEPHYVPLLYPAQGLVGRRPPFPAPFLGGL